MNFGSKKHFYDKMTPREFVRYTSRKLKDRKRRHLMKKVKMNLNIVAPILIGLVFYVWQINEWLNSEIRVVNYQYEGVIEFYVRYLFLFVAFPAFIIMKAFEYFDIIKEDSRAHFEVVLYYWTIYGIMLFITAAKALDSIGFFD